MKNNTVNLNIETLVLVAIWTTPFVFQGSFTITNLLTNSTQLLFFRCECNFKDKMDILNIDFSPHDYQFTHLSSEQSQIDLTTIYSNLENALYILKYALAQALQKMIINPKHFLSQIDEIASASISKQIKHYWLAKVQNKMDDDIGFAVSINFSPDNHLGKTAALALLKINNYSLLESDHADEDYHRAATLIH